MLATRVRTERGIAGDLLRRELALPVPDGAPAVKGIRADDPGALIGEVAPYVQFPFFLRSRDWLAWLPDDASLVERVAGLSERAVLSWLAVAPRPAVRRAAVLRMLTYDDLGRRELRFVLDTNATPSHEPYDDDMAAALTRLASRLQPATGFVLLIAAGALHPRAARWRPAAAAFLAGPRRDLMVDLLRTFGKGELTVRTALIAREHGVDLGSWPADDRNPRVARIARGDRVRVSSGEQIDHRPLVWKDLRTARWLATKHGPAIADAAGPVDAGIAWYLAAIGAIREADRDPARWTPYLRRLVENPRGGIAPSDARDQVFRRHLSAGCPGGYLLARAIEPMARQGRPTDAAAAWLRQMRLAD